MENDSTNEQIVEVETMTDEALEEAVSGPSETEVVETDPGEPAPVEEEAAPPTVEELQAQVEAANSRAEQLQKERDFHQQTVGKHSDELGRLRKIDEALKQRLEQNKAKDPAQLFIDDPQAMMDAAAERAEINLEMRQNANQVEQLNQQQAFMQNAYQIDRVAPDLKDNIDGIADMLKEYGDTPEAIQNFRNNPAMFPADKVQQINELYRSRKQIADQQAQLEQYKTRGSEQLQKVEQAAQHQPMSNAATGASSNGDGGFPENMSTSDISKLSDKDLDAILGAGQ